MATSTAALAATDQLFAALAAKDHALIAQLCTAGLACAAGPGGLTALHACALLDSPEPVRRRGSRGRNICS